MPGLTDLINTAANTTFRSVSFIRLFGCMNAKTADKQSYPFFQEEINRNSEESIKNFSPVILEETVFKKIV